ncbi:MAG: hypothetical protein IBX72_14940 [Nitrospirae bacterium]|nr:hypothetical protein [Nitrospirota bacterium]
MANIIHKGPYEDCTPTYEKLYAWLEENHKKFVGSILVRNATEKGLECEF